MTNKESSPVSDLVERMGWTIRNWESEEPKEDWWQHQSDHAEAADRLTALEAENARLRNADWMNRCRMLIDLIEYMNSNEESADGEDLDMVMAFKADLPSEAPQGGDHGE